mmetsp:Transcript_21135/g.53726  ORF Transcript_21135/g.53726 Transcript_21135/m.53726 type:complete len:329 (+) Transcript_21135:386-1372(+)
MVQHTWLGHVTAWMSNVATSVVIVFVNKMLMDSEIGYGFAYATSLSAFHYFASASFAKCLEVTGYSEPVKLPLADIVSFSAVASVSVASLNISLLLNTVGFYQISKLMVIPCVCVLERVWFARHFSRKTLISICVVIGGVAVVTVTDISVNLAGMIIASVSVVASGLQQVMCGMMQRRHNITSMQLLSATAPMQGLMLILVGPFVDQLVTGRWIVNSIYTLTPSCFAVISASCLIAIAVNVSQFVCLGRFSAVTFQVLGHTKTFLVLFLGWFLLHDVINDRKLTGIVLAISGMIAYGIFSSSDTTAKNGESCNKPTIDLSSQPKSLVL